MKCNKCSKTPKEDMEVSKRKYWSKKEINKSAEDARVVIEANSDYYDNLTLQDNKK